MGIRFSYLKRLRFNLLSKFFQLFLLVILALANTKLSYASPQTPSQALPKMFQKPPGIDYYQFKKQETVVPKMPQIDVNQQLKAV